MAYKKNVKKTGLRYPAINDLIGKAENKYELVLAAAKRAREIVAGADPLVKIDINNPVSIATKEIDEEAVRILSGVESMIEPEVVFPEDDAEDGMTTAEMAEDMVIDV